MSSNLKLSYFKYKNIKKIINIKTIKLLLVLLCLCIIILIILKYNKLELFENNNELIGLNKCDGIVYINLENREDRKKLFLEEIKKINLDETKLHKVSGVYIPKNGHKGCIQSHIIALRIAKMNNWNIACIMEDDAELTVESDIFNNTINNIFNEIKEKNIQWDVISLMVSNKSIYDTSYEFIDKLKEGTSALCYIIRKEYISKILSLFEHCQSMMSSEKWGENDSDDYEPYALDQKWNDLIKRDNWYASKQNLIKNRNIKSTINSRGN